MDGHNKAFAFFGGVPQSTLYDNDKCLVVRKLPDGTRQRTRAFSGLQSHYLFEDRYGRPGKGNDRGKVEGLVGYARRNFMAPVRRFESWEAFNAYLEEQCRKRQSDVLRGHRETIGERFVRDQEVLTELPPAPFDACDKQGTGVNSLHRDFTMAFGEMTEVQFTEFLCQTLAKLATHSVGGSIHYVCMDWRHLFELLTAARAVYSEVKNLCVWNKSNAGMGSRYRSKHELVIVFKNGNGPHINNVELGRLGRHRSNVWDYAGVNTLRSNRLAELAMHPTVKPVALVAEAILDCSRRGGIVLDAFAGSGTTVIASERTGRRPIEADRPGPGTARDLHARRSLHIRDGGGGRHEQLLLHPDAAAQLPRTRHHPGDPPWPPAGGPQCPQADDQHPRAHRLG